jgi:hypothetical protein
MTNVIGIWAPVDAAQNEDTVWAALSAIFAGSRPKEAQPERKGVLEKLGMRK